MSAAAWIVVLWIAFAATHTLPSSATLRPRLVAKLGAGLFLGLYSLAAFAVFIPLVTVWIRNLHSGELLWSLQLGPLRPAVLVVSGLAFTFSVASLFQPSPASAGRAASDSHGLTRITRHPLFLPFAVLGAMHLPLFGYATDVAFFGGLVLYSILGCIHQDVRKRATEPELRRFFEQTSFLPFVAILTRRNRLVLSELPWLGLLVGGAAAYGFYWLHPVLFR